MAQSTTVPKFGNWENEENVPYTVYFEKARKGRSQGKMNRIESQENSDSFNTKKPPIQASSFQMGQEGTDLRSTDSSLHHSFNANDAGHRDSPKPLKQKHDHKRGGRRDTGARRVAVDSLNHHKRGMQRSAVSDLSIEHSPNRTKVGGKGNGLSSLSWERNGSSDGTHGQAPMTPGTSRLRSATQADDTPDGSAAVPKFGDWDETNPASADGYTHIFNRVRQERQGGAAKVPVLPTERSHSNGQKKYGKEKSKSCCCFPW
ncbi:hypothetical protein JCGZ_01101 [Jatropha curcas]|uniref:RIN4 pathogenic type III effector avirulence factor Avr cleavage site domain-containing protein n=1 Tax=Jatropha curcas TaxID=180498 RepID=A0A067L5G7_JATCU|nr:RPM1-interacting protein 4 isoform X2 [Jatropha curcas]KDP39344.1 hypothetical protein JCGZ_01101 [Jatropha curcas]